MSTLFVNVTVIDCTGGEPFAGEVLVGGERIRSVARGADVLPREDSQVIDGKGAFLMPGLVESHAHLSIDNTGDLAELGRIPPEEHTLLTMRVAKLYLDRDIPTRNGLSLENISPGSNGSLKVGFSNDETIEANSIVLALGKGSARIDLPGVESAGIANKIGEFDAFLKGPACVIGSGTSAVMLIRDLPMLVTEQGWR